MCKPNKKAKRSILIIEDDRLQMKMLASLLETEDLEPICCRTGREALTASQQQSVNVAILDLQLPDMDGVELLKQLKAQNPHIKIIINTGYPTLESAMAAVNHEAFAYVQKMGNVEELLTHVHRAFHRHLADYSEVLEGQVKDQTDELLETNQELRKEITERKQAEAALARRAEEMAALYETSLEINAQLDPKNLLQSIVQRAATLLNTEMGGVFLLQPDGETLKLVVAHNQSEEYLGATMRLGEGLAGRIAQTGDVLSVPDYRHWEDRANVPCAEVIGRILGVPLKHGDQVMGVITVFDEEAGTFDQNQIRLLRLFAAQAAVAVENTRLFDETYRRARQLAILNELAGEMAGLLDTEELCETVVQRMFLKFGDRPRTTLTQFELG